MADKAKNQDQENDPSIEEILDSIRKIISDDDEADSEGADKAKKAADADDTGDSIPEPDIEAVDAAPIAKEKKAEKEEEKTIRYEEDEPDDDFASDIDLDALIEQSDEDDAGDEDVLELTEMIEADDDAGDIDLEPENTLDDEIGSLSNHQDDEDESEVEDETDDIDDTISLADNDIEFRDPQDNDDSLLSDAAADKAASALAKLQAHEDDEDDSKPRQSDSALRPEMTVSNQSLDHMVRQMLDPMLREMLKEWLDNNLPDLVEDMVQHEIEKLTRKKR